jgi:TonB family protein
LSLSLAASLALHAAVLWIAGDLGNGAVSGGGVGSSGRESLVHLSVRFAQGDARIATSSTVEPEGSGLSVDDRPERNPEPMPPDPARSVRDNPADLPGPAYHMPDALTVRPEPLKPIEPVYPFRSREVARGRIVLRLMINSGGTVDRVLIEESELGTRFEDAAVSAFAAARFSPGKIGETPVGSQMRVEVTFESDLAGQ